MRTDVLVMFEPVFPPLCLSAVMQLENLTQNINSTAQEVVGVLLSKDETGVTAIVTLSSTLEAVVFFDGYTAQIQLTGTDTKIYHLGLNEQLNIWSISNVT